MTPQWARAGSPNNPSIIRNRSSYYMKSITYLLCVFSCAWTAQCLADSCDLPPGPFFVLGAVSSAFGLSQAFTRRCKRRRRS